VHKETKNHQQTQHGHQKTEITKGTDSNAIIQLPPRRTRSVTKCVSWMGFMRVVTYLPGSEALIDISKSELTPVEELQLPPPKKACLVLKKKRV
jgi:hypothetical protein